MSEAIPVVHAPRPLRPVPLRHPGAAAAPHITIPQDRITGPQSPQSPAAALQESVHTVPSMIVEAIPAGMAGLGEAISPSQLLASPQRLVESGNPFANSHLQPLEANGQSAVAVSAPTAAAANKTASAAVKAARSTKAGTKRRWAADEERKLSQLAAQHGFKKKDWGDKAIALGTGRTAASVEQHWSTMVRKQQAAARAADGDESQEAATDTLTGTAATMPDSGDVGPADALDDGVVLGRPAKHPRLGTHEKHPRWLVWEEDFLKSLVKDEGAKYRDWARKATKLGTGRTGCAVEQHWGFMMLQDKLEEEEALAQAGLPTGSAAAAAAAAAAPGAAVGQQSVGSGSGSAAVPVWKDDMTIEEKLSWHRMQDQLRLGRALEQQKRMAQKSEGGAIVAAKTSSLPVAQPVVDEQAVPETNAAAMMMDNRTLHALPCPQLPDLDSGTSSSAHWGATQQPTDLPITGSAHW